jgi:hypothetical protein
MNDYLSRYSNHDTHFHRTDPFKYHTWEDEEEISTLVMVLSGLGFVFVLCCCLAIVFW